MCIRDRPQVDSTKIFSDTVAQRGKMVYKVTRQVEDDIVYDDERDLDKSTFTAVSYTHLVEKNFEEAVKWYTKAANQEYARAQSFLATPSPLS